MDVLKRLSAMAVLDALERLGARARVVDGQLLVSNTSRLVFPRDRDIIAEHRDELVYLLTIKEEQ